MIEPLLFVVAMGVFGLLVGSFLNVVIYRIPVMMEREWRSECQSLLNPEATPAAPGEPFNLAVPRSRCPACAAQIGARDNLPVFSYLLLGGKCRYCKSKISPRYPLVELFCACLTAGCAWQFGSAEGIVTAMTVFHTLAASLLCWYLVALALIDYDTGLLPDSLTLPLLWGGLMCSFFGLFAADLESAVVGAISGYLSFWAVYWAFKLTTGKEGMGYGDFKLLAALGAWFGWQALPALILVSSVVGATIGIAMMMAGNLKRAQPIPFGPYLALAGLVMLFAADTISALLTPGGAL